MDKSDIHFHDPLIIFDSGNYYCFSTDTSLNGVQISISGDLLHWRLHKTAFNRIPSQIAAHTGKAHFWAPEVVKSGGEYRLYFCSSSIGSTQSMIGLAVSDTIDGDYQYVGDVVKTYEAGSIDTPNAIDPNVILDRDGTPYLVFGSFFGGIRIAPLTPDGFLTGPGYGSVIAGGRHTAVEGAYVIYDSHSDYFFLFLSYGSLNYDYNIRVAKSRNITGPYMDSRGYAVTDLDPVLSVGDKIAGGYNFDLPGCEGYMAPGHNSVLQLEDGLYAVHHIRREGVLRPARLHMRRIYFSEHGQLYLSPVPFDGTKPRTPASAEFSGGLSVVRFDRFNNGVVYGRKLSFGDFPWHYDEDTGGITLTLYNKDYTGTALVQSGVLYITAVSRDGECLWAKGINSEEMSL